MFGAQLAPGPCSPRVGQPQMRCAPGAGPGRHRDALCSLRPAPELSCHPGPVPFLPRLLLLAPGGWSTEMGRGSSPGTASGIHTQHGVSSWPGALTCLRSRGGLCPYLRLPPHVIPPAVAFPGLALGPHAMPSCWNISAASSEEGLVWCLGACVTLC